MNNSEALDTQLWQEKEESLKKNMAINNPSCCASLWEPPYGLNISALADIPRKRMIWALAVIGMLKDICIYKKKKNTKYTLFTPNEWRQPWAHAVGVSNGSSCNCHPHTLRSFFPVGASSTPFFCSFHSRSHARGDGHCCCVTWLAGGYFLSQAFRAEPEK